jgi:hypothetical protein
LQVITKSSLSSAQQHLVELLQQINYGRIERLLVRKGEPVFDPVPQVIQKVKMGGGNGPRPEIGLPDFVLRSQTVELLEQIAKIGDGEIAVIEVKAGLPWSIDLQHRIPSATFVPSN